jgi:hypothetical protein
VSARALRLYAAVARRRPHSREEAQAIAAAHGCPESAVWAAVRDWENAQLADEDAALRAKLTAAGTRAA